MWSPTTGRSMLSPGLSSGLTLELRRPEPLRGFGREPLGGFSEEQQRGRRCQRDGQLDGALFTVGKLASLVVSLSPTGPPVPGLDALPR
jgi:hypothetical protein